MCLPPNDLRILRDGPLDVIKGQPQRSSARAAPASCMRWLGHRPGAGSQLN